MKKPVVCYISLLCMWSFLLFSAVILHAQEEDNSALDRTIRLPKNKTTVYKMLGQITDRTGFLFIYDSNLINNDRQVNFKAGEYTVGEAIRIIINDKSLALRVMGNHILIHKAQNTIQQSALPPPEPEIETPRYLSVEGKVYNRLTNEPIAYASIGITEEAIGTITNQNGDFVFRIPDSLRNTQIHFSHIGFIPQEIKASILANGYHQIQLEPKVVPLQEVVVRIVNPIRLIEDMLEKRPDNYSMDPVYHTTFYREGIEQRKGLTSLSEAVFQIYKTPYRDTHWQDQVKLVKMRRIINNEERDTLMTKFKSGINACLMLDIVKHLPDFLSREGVNLYEYAHMDVTVVDDRLAHVVSFEQRRGIPFPLYRGELYIDAENSALLLAKFEIHPDFVDKTAGMFVERKSRHLSITPQRIMYTVAYKPWNGTYYINHIRGDLHFKIKKKRRWFSSNLHTWFEMVTCKTDIEDVNRFSRKETLPTHTVFSETNFQYDESFWENLNTIAPEEKLTDAISRIRSKIEETGY